MPIYQETRTFESGFYNNKVVNGINDRVYSAEDMNEPYAGIFTDGIRPNSKGVLSDDLAVQFVTGMRIEVLAGRGMFGGKYFKNKGSYMITLDAPIVSTRYDAIIVRADTNEEVRDTNIYVKSLEHIPTIYDLERSEKVKEYLLAYVTVVGQSVEISQANITDTRIDQEVCGLITGVYQELDGKAIYAQWQQVFNDWLDTVRDELKTKATIDRLYFSQYITRYTNEYIIPIQIPQFSKELDDLIVVINGIVLSPESQYKILSNSQIELTIPLPLENQMILFIVSKSMDGTEANTIANEFVALQKRVQVLEKSGIYQYNCNGVNDNVELSKLVKAFLEQDTNNSDYGIYTIYVSGTFGATAPFSGAGTSSSPYRWFEAGLGTSTNRKVILDFSNCSFIRLNCESEKHYIVFYGMNVDIRNCNITASGQTSYIKMFSSSTLTRVYAENCRFRLTGKDDCYIARSGTFKNCRGSVTNTTLNSNCFSVGDASLLRVEGGEYYAYTYNSTGTSAIVYVGSADKNAVAITYAINCPTVARSGYYQTHAINCLSNSDKCSFTDTITTLQVIGAGQNIRGTLAVSKQGMM